MESDNALDTFMRLFGDEFAHGKPFDLSHLRRVLDQLGAPHARLPPVIHVAGTNGKGSTIAFMRAIAEASGLRVHAFTKPHLFKLRERFIVAGAAADDSALVETAARFAAVSRDLTQFDAQVAAALILFSETPADLVLLETGMGGLSDSTNVLERSAASVITPIGLDHQDALGSTVTEIARHKAGIMKPGSPVFIARQPSEVMAVIEAHAARVDAPLHRCGVEWDAFHSHGRLVVQTESRALDLPLPSLAGAHQIDNAGLACATLLGLTHVAFDDAAFAAGVASATWPGRLQPLTRGPLKQRAGSAELWVDGAHNAHAAQALVHALQRMQRKRPARTALILGFRARKDWRPFVDLVAPLSDLLIAVPLPEGADPAELAARAGHNAQTAPDLSSAVDAAIGGGGERILICGSLALAAMALTA